MAELVVGLMPPNKFTLRNISSLLMGDIIVKHKLKRLINFLDKVKIDEEFWKSFIKLVFCLPYFKLNKREIITLVIDSTNLRDNFWVLAATIAYKSRAIPVYLKIWRDPNSSYNFWGRVSKFLEELKMILPKGFKYDLIADRGFQSIRLFEICKSLDWYYVVRINGNWMCKVSDGEYYIQLSLFEDGFYENVILGNKSRYEYVNVSINSIINEEGGKARWYLATNLGDRELVIRDYERRMWIEESFRDLKDILKWEQYTKKIPQKGILEKLITLTLISYTIGLSIGTKVIVASAEENKISIYKGFQHLMVSWGRNAYKILNTLITMFCIYLWRTLAI